MAKFKSKYNRNKNTSPVRERSLFDSIYSKQTKDVKIHAGLMSVFYNQVTSQSKLTALRRKHKRSF
jgi:hypothetical protein